jgi:hypothetical protein
MIKISDEWYELGFHDHVYDDHDKFIELKAKGIHSNARDRVNQIAKKFKTEKQAEKYMASLPKELQKYYRVRTLFGLF